MDSQSARQYRGLVVEACLRTVGVLVVVLKIEDCLRYRVHRLSPSLGRNQLVSRPVVLLKYLAQKCATIRIYYNFCPFGTANYPEIVTMWGEWCCRHFRGRVVLSSRHVSAPSFLPAYSPRSLAHSMLRAAPSSRHLWIQPWPSSLSEPCRPRARPTPFALLSFPLLSDLPFPLPHNKDLYGSLFNLAARLIMPGWKPSSP